MSWRAILKQTLPTSEVALFSMLGSDATTNILIELINKSDVKGKKKTGAGKNKFNQLIKKFDDANPESLLNSMEKSTQNMVKDQIDTIFENFQRVKREIASRMSRKGYNFDTLDQYLVDDEKIVTYLYNNHRKASLKKLVRGATPSQLSKMKQLFEKYAKKPKSYDKFDETLNYNYAKLKVTVIDSPLESISGFESEKGPTKFATVFKLVFKLDENKEISLQFQEKVDKIQQKLQQKDKSFKLSEDNAKIETHISKNTKEFNPKYAKIKDFKFQEAPVKRKYRVAEVDNLTVEGYFKLLTTNYGDNNKAITKELLFKIKGDSIANKEFGIVIPTGNQYIPNDFVYGVLVTAKKGIKAYESAEQATLSGARGESLYQVTISEEGERSVKVSDKVEDTQETAFIQYVPLEVTDVLEITTDPDKRKKLQIDGNKVKLTEQLKEYIIREKPVADDDALMELNSEFDPEKYNWQIFIINESVGVQEDVKNVLDALINLAKEEDETIVDLMYGDKVRPKLDSDKAEYNLLSFLRLLEKYITGKSDDLAEKIYTPDQQDKEQGVNSEAIEPFLKALDEEITLLQDLFKEGIEKKFLDIISNPYKYPAIYKIKADRTISEDLKESLPSQFFSLNIKGNSVSFIEVEE